MWKFGNNKVAEFDPYFEQTEATYYTIWKGRANLDVKSGNLTISDLTAKDDGEFSVEINNVKQSVKISLKVIRKFMLSFGEIM